MSTDKLFISFMCFWESFDPNDNVYVDLLRKHYDVVVITDKSEYNLVSMVFYSCFGDRRNVYKFFPTAKKVYVSGENDVPDFNFCDYSISHCPYDFGERNVRYPNWCFTYHKKDIAAMRLTKETYDDSLFDRGFCSFVVSNNNNAHPMRTKLFKLLNESIDNVASGGACLNNIGHRVDDKNDFISRYKFNIAAENSFVDGYVTEKIADALVSRTVPIYMGDKMAGEDFNHDAFISVTDFPTFGELVKFINQVKDDKECYKDFLCAPLFNEKNMQKFYTDRLESFLVGVVEYGSVLIHLYGRQGIKLSNNLIIS